MQTVKVRNFWMKSQSYKTTVLYVFAQTRLRFFKTGLKRSAISRKSSSVVGQSIQAPVVHWRQLPSRRHRCWPPKPIRIALARALNPSIHSSRTSRKPSATKAPLPGSCLNRNLIRWHPYPENRNRLRKNSTG